MTDPVIANLDAIALDGLRYHAIVLRRTAGSVEQYAKAVVFKREFETVAEDELERAKVSLEAALITVTTALMEYQDKRPAFKQAAE